MAFRLIPRWVGLPRLDVALLLALLLVMGIGLLVLYSASNEDMAAVWRQSVRLGVGMVGLLVLSQVPPHILRMWTPWLYGLGIVLVVLGAVFLFTAIVEFCPLYAPFKFSTYKG